MILCTSCQHENDDTRIFCQNCGIRLPKAGEVSGEAAGESAAVPAKPSPPPPQARPKEVKPKSTIRPTRPASTFSIGGVFSTLVRTLVMAAIAAALIQALRSPSDIPDPISPNEDVSRKIQAVISEAAQNPFPRVVTVRPNNVNTVLAASLIAGEGGGIINDLVKFKRVFVRFKNGGFDLVKEQTYGPLPVYLGLEFKQQGNGTNMEISGGFIGRLPIHPLIAARMAPLFKVVAEGFSSQIGVLKTARSVRITPESADLDFPGKG